MAYTEENKTAISLKLLSGKSHSDLAKGTSNEAESSFINIPADKVFADAINIDPAQAIIDGVALLINADLILDPTSNGHGFFAVKPILINSGAGTLTIGLRYVCITTSVSDGVTYNVGEAFTSTSEDLTSGSVKEIIKNSISNSLGNGYEAKPKIGATAISTNDPRNWYYNYQSGVFFQQDIVGGVPTKINVYQYIGTLGVGSGSGSSVLEPRTVYVSKSGDDTSGTIGGSSTSFLTLNAAYTYAKTQSPTQADPVEIRLTSGVYTEDVITDTQHIHIKGNSFEPLLDPSNPGLGQGNYVAGTAGTAGSKAVGGWDIIGDPADTIFNDRVGSTITVGAEVWVYADPFINAPFTMGSTSPSPNPFISGLSIINNFIIRFNADNTQGLRAYVNDGNDLENDLGTIWSDNFEGLTISSITDSPIANGTTLTMLPTSWWDAGFSETNLSGGLAGITPVPGTDDPTRKRSTIIDGTIEITGANTKVSNLDCTSGIIIGGALQGIYLVNVCSYGDIVNTAEDDLTTMLDVHAPQLLSKCDLGGSYVNCSGGDYSFAGVVKSDTIPASLVGYLNNCHALDFSFGIRSEINAHIVDCKAKDKSFGRHLPDSYTRGFYHNCIGEVECFNSELFIRTSFLQCTAKSGSFFSNVAFFSGTTTLGSLVNIDGCQADVSSFGYSLGGTVVVTSSISIRNCYARDQSFFSGSSGLNSNIDTSSTDEAQNIVLQNCHVRALSSENTANGSSHSFFSYLNGTVRNVTMIGCYTNGSIMELGYNGTTIFENVDLIGCKAYHLMLMDSSNPATITLNKVNVLGGNYKFILSQNQQNTLSTVLLTVEDFTIIGVKVREMIKLSLLSTAVVNNRFLIKGCEIETLGTNSFTAIENITYEDCNITNIKTFGDGKYINCTLSSTSKHPGSNSDVFTDCKIGEIELSDDGIITRTSFTVPDSGVIGANVIMTNCDIYMTDNLNILTGCKLTNCQVVAGGIEFKSDCESVGTTYELSTSSVGNGQDGLLLSGDNISFVDCNFKTGRIRPHPITNTNITIKNTIISASGGNLLYLGTNCTIDNSHISPAFILHSGARVRNFVYTDINNGLSISPGSTDIIIENSRFRNVFKNGSGGTPTIQLINCSMRLAPTFLTLAIDYNNLIDPTLIL